MSNKGISTLKIAGTYIGTIVGAGFASGQEILQFFAVFGAKGLLGLLFATAMFIVFGYIIMDLGKRLDSYSHLQIIKFSGGKWLGTTMDYIITFFLFGALSAMIAGAGAMFSQQFGLSNLWGNAIMAIATAATVLTGLTGVINSISLVVPFLLVSAVGISAISVFIIPTPVPAITTTSFSGSLIQNWLLAAILYTSYNIVLSIAILGPLGTQAPNNKIIRRGALLGGLGLGLGAIAIYLALSKNMNSIKNLEVPMIFIAGRISYNVQIIYIIVLLAEIYTTAVGSLYGFIARITDPQLSTAKHFILGTTVLAFIASQFGFSNLVKYLYPVVGYSGIILLIALLYSKIKLSIIRIK